MSSLKLFFYFLKALRHNFFQLWSDDTSSKVLVIEQIPPFLRGVRGDQIKYYYDIAD